MATRVIEGLDTLLNDLSQLESKMQKKHVNHALRAGAKVMQADAAHRAKRFDDPLTAQNIAASIKVRANTKWAKQHGADAGVAVTVSADADTKRTAYFLEYGTSKTPAQPFMRPAQHASADKAISVAVADLKKSLSL